MRNTRAVTFINQFIVQLRWTYFSKGYIATFTTNVSDTYDPLKAYI